MKKIPLTRGYMAMVDDEDYEWLMQWKWGVHITGNRRYARRTVYKNGKAVMVIMHRLIMNTPDGMQVDHIDHDGLNNQKQNLRNCSKHQNSYNMSSHKDGSSRFLGVCHINQCRKGVNYHYILAQITVNYKKIYLGLFNDEEKAATAYDAAAKKYFGEFANLNFPNG